MSMHSHDGEECPDNFSAIIYALTALDSSIITVSAGIVVITKSSVRTVNEH